MSSIMNMLGSFLGGASEDDAVAKKADTEQPTKDTDTDAAAAKVDAPTPAGTAADKSLGKEPSLPDVDKLTLSDASSSSTSSEPARPPPPAYSEDTGLKEKPATKYPANQKPAAKDSANHEDPVEQPISAEMSQRISMMKQQLQMICDGPEAEVKKTAEVMQKQEEVFRSQLSVRPDMLDGLYGQAKHMGYTGPKESEPIISAIMKNMKALTTQNRKALSDMAKANGMTDVAFLENQINVTVKIAKSEYLAHKQMAAPGATKPDLRFSVGSRVKCNLGPGGWQSGRVVKQWYREPKWPEGKLAPYQIKIDKGTLIYCPMDDDRFIMASA